MKDCAQSLIDITPFMTKKPKYKGFRDRHLFRYNIDDFRKSVRFMNYDFHNSIPVPDNHFAVPYSTDTVSCNHNGISYRQFAYLKKKDINLSMKKCPMYCNEFDAHLDLFASDVIPCIDPYKCATTDFSISKTFGTSYNNEITVTEESGEFSNVKNKHQIVLSYWHKEQENMQVVKDCNPGFLSKLLSFTYNKFHASRDRTNGMGINVYDGRIQGKAFIDTPHRHGRDCRDHEYYSQEWNPSFMPVISKMRRVLVTATSQITQMIDPLQIRLLNIASGF